MSRQGSEIIAGTTAIQQALFFHYGLSMRDIANAMNLQYTTVYTNVWRRNDRCRSYPWSLRKHKHEAIAAAGAVVERWKRETLKRDLETARQRVRELETMLEAMFAKESNVST